MKKTFIGIVFILSLLFLSSCVKEKPEPIYIPPAAPEERTQIRVSQAQGMSFAIFSDDTCELICLNSDFQGNTLTLPSHFDNYPLVGIQKEAFSGRTLTFISLPETIREIQDKAFQYTKIERIVLPDSVTVLGEYVFYNCLQLKEVTLSKNLKSIPTSTFDSCSSLKNLVIPEGVTSIGEEAFAGCTAMETITLPSTLNSIGAWAFWSCGTSSLEFSIPANVKEIQAHAFRETAWLKKQTDEFFLVGDGILLAYNGTDETVILPEEVKYLSSAFHSSPAKSVTVPASLVGVCTFPFEDSLITSVHYSGTNEEIKNRLNLI